jgi:hypothetical protein
VRFLFVTYCFGAWNGQALIGVYKRGLRVAMELVARGHHVDFFCTGRHAYRDGLVEAAERCMTFVDIPFSVEALDAAEEVRQGMLAAMSELRPDAVVVGESPLAGAMMEAALCAVELGIPLAILDNAYHPDFVDYFCRVNGGLADGIVLTGPSSFHTASPPPFLCQVPAFIEPAPEEEIEAALGEAGLGGGRLITVLAYDEKVEKLGLSLLPSLAQDGVEAAFLSRDPERCRERLAALPEATRRRAGVLAIPPDRVLFGLIRRARLAIAKYGFMQVSECLSLSTPVIAVYHEGPRWLDSFPTACRSATHMTHEAEADAATVAAARHMLALGPEALAGVHDGSLRAAPRAAEFLERLRLRSPAETLTGAEELGIDARAFRRALRAHLGRPPRGLAVRAMYSRELPDCCIHAVVCRSEVDGDRTCVRLWGRVYASRRAARRDRRAARDNDSQRRVLYFSGRRRLMLELDLGQARLPPL